MYYNCNVKQVYVIAHYKDYIPLLLGKYSTLSGVRFYLVGKQPIKRCEKVVSCIAFRIRSDLVGKYLEVSDMSVVA